MSKTTTNPTSLNLALDIELENAQRQSTVQLDPAVTTKLKLQLCREDNTYATTTNIKEKFLCFLSVKHTLQNQAIRLTRGGAAVRPEPLVARTTPSPQRRPRPGKKDEQHADSAQRRSVCCGGLSFLARCVQPRANRIFSASTFADVRVNLCAQSPAKSLVTRESRKQDYTFTTIIARERIVQSLDE